MTITSNIFVNITAWAPSTSYSLGARRTNGGNAYQCITVGTSASSGGPGGTGSSITDGSVTWKYLAAADYVTLASWVAGIPGALTQPVVGLLWDCGALTTIAGVPYFTLSGHTTSSTNTITLKPAPGESIRDILATGTSPLALHTAAGVRFILPSAIGNVNYFTISDPNVIFEGLQFQDPFSTSNSTIIATREPGSLVLRDSIIDGYTQVGGASPFDCAAQITGYNNLIIDRQPSSGAGAVAIGLYAGAASSRFINCTFIAPNSPVSNGGLIGSSVTGCYVRNCVIAGYTTPNFASTVNIAFDHSATDVASFGTFTTDSGGNLFSITASSQFINTATDFRLKAGSGLIGKGTSDTTDIPTADDIAGHTRVGWDIGASQYSIGVTSSSSLLVLRGALAAFSSAFSKAFSTSSAIGYASLTTSVSFAQSKSLFLALSSTSNVQQKCNASASARVIFVQSASAAISSYPATALAYFSDPFSSEFSTEFGPNALLAGNGTATLTQPASALLSFVTISSSGSAVSLGSSGRSTIITLSSSGVIAQLGATLSLLDLTCIAMAQPLLAFSGAANIEWQSSVSQMSSSTTASGSGVLALSAVANGGQQAAASGLSAILHLSLNGAIGSSCSATIMVLGLSASVSANQFDVAFGISSVALLAISKPVSPLLKSDAATSLFLAADSSGLLLAADIIVPNLSSATSGAGLATIPAISCAAHALLQIFWSGVETVIFPAAAEAQQFDRASTIVALPVIGAEATAVQRGGAAGLASLDRLSASAQFGQVNSSAGLATIPSPSAAGEAQGYARAFGSASIGTSATGLALTSGAAIARTTALSLSASGAASFVFASQGTASIALSAAAQLGQVDNLSGSATVQVVAGVGAATVGMLVSGSAIIPGLSASGIAAQTTPTTGTGVIPALAAAGTAVNAVEVALGITTLMSLTPSATAEVHGASMSGVSSIAFSSSGAIISEVEASVLVELEQIVEAHARLWTTPIGYEQGELVVFWQD